MQFFARPVKMQLPVSQPMGPMRGTAGLQIPSNFSQEGVYFAWKIVYNVCDYKSEEQEYD